MPPQGFAAYVQVTNELRALVLSTPWGTNGMLPPEPALVERFRVSRGTLRRATEELEREGLLLIERGRGTSIRRHAQVRALIRERLEQIAVPDSRWHLDVLKFVPDFAGSDRARDRLLAHPALASAATVFVAPDNSLTELVPRLLERSIRVLVPTYGMRRGIVLLDPATVAPNDRAFASTLDGLDRFGVRLDTDALRSVGAVDALVTGAIAFTTAGIHVGSGDAYIDLEWGILATLGLVGEHTPVLGIAHDIQVVDTPLEAKPLDVTVDAVATPTRLVDTSAHPRRPVGIDAARLTNEHLDDIAYLRDLVSTEDWTL
ncbi:MAG: 5-formyltetrahydrofolate cyclo-ligase [Microbacterium sp.]|uniref:5-formyltetrahydrofolate cyclo-ligase n=1 Tax=Microbacterium sp. TaxID=51671 RepID=UPI0027260810|nr:5-formyltetrahydrofolate cyclo-ligase [Microbacterium sp.]MDO8382977.1 5-formyltetrahydrofolate cyclo-ligase [Microbacterium sp.]